MFCQRCNAQFPDHSNFCFHCGLQMNPNIPPQPGMSFQNMSPMGIQQMPLGNQISSDEKLYRLSLISFCCIGFWFLIHLINRFVMRDIMYEFKAIFDLISVATSSAVLIFGLAWYKEKSKKPILIVFLIVGILLCLIDKFTLAYYY